MLRAAVLVGLGAGVLLLSAAGGLAWRLSRGPLALDWLAPRVEAAAQARGVRLSLAGVALGWSGFSDPGAPLRVVLRDMRVGPPDRPAAAAARLEVSLALGPLLSGHVGPGTVTVGSARVTLVRGADGLRLADGTALPAPWGPGVAAQDGPAGLPGWLAGLDEVVATDTRVGLLDGPPGVTWAASVPRLALRRTAAGLSGDAEVALSVQASSPGTAGPGSPGPPGPAGSGQSLPGPTAPGSSTPGAPAPEPSAPESSAPGPSTPGPSTPGPSTPGPSAQGEPPSGTPAAGMSDVLRLSVRPDPRQAGWSVLRAHLDPFGPAALGRLVPGLPQGIGAALAAVDAPVTLDAEAALDPDLSPRRYGGAVAAGEGRVTAGGAVLGLAGLSLRGEGTPEAATLTLERLALAPPPGARAPPPTFQGTATLRRDAGGLLAQVSLGVDHAAFGELAGYWPAGLGRGARTWVTRNLTAGTAHDGHVELTLRAAADGSGLRLAAAGGQLLGDDVTVHWLTPVPPAEHVRARLVLEGPDALSVATLGGSNGGGSNGDGSDGVGSGGEGGGRGQGGRGQNGRDEGGSDPGGRDRGVRDGSGRAGARGGGAGNAAARDGVRFGAGLVRITGLSSKDQVAAIGLDVHGGVAALVRLLSHPRLRLLSKHPPGFTDPQGRFATRLDLTIPLERDLDADRIGLRSHTRLDDVHLGGVAAGQDLDQGALELDVTTQGLAASGTGSVARIPVRLTLDMDFRAGGPDQVVQRASVHGQGDAARLGEAGLDLAGVVDGPVGLDARYSERRDGRASVAVAADLSAAALDVPLGWSKPAGPPAEARAVLLLEHGHLRGIDLLRATAPGLSLRGQAEGGARGTLLRIETAVIGRTRASGTVSFPQRRDGVVRADVSGPVLDLSSLFDGGPAGTGPGPAARMAGAAAGAAQDDPAEGQGSGHGTGHGAGEGVRPGAPAAAGRAGTPWVLDARFGRVLLGRGRSIAPVSAHVEDDGRRLDAVRMQAGEGAASAVLTLSGQPAPADPEAGTTAGRSAALGSAAPGPAEGPTAPGRATRSAAPGPARKPAPPGPAEAPAAAGPATRPGLAAPGAMAGPAGAGAVRRFELKAADAGALLSSLDVTDAVRGGRLTLSGTLEGDESGPPLAATLHLSDLNLLDAPAIGRVLQGVTVFGLVDLMHGPGLHVGEVDVPFRMAERIVTVHDARAYSASLGATASGRVDLAARTVDLSGTVVPAYFFNQLPGRLPLVGRLFSPERGGGVFAATYTVSGPLDQPRVSVNPAAVAAPGFVRRLLGLP